MDSGGPQTWVQIPVLLLPGSVTLSKPLPLSGPEFPPLKLAD